MADPAVTSPARTPKTPDDSRVVLAHIMSEHDTHLYGTLHGGVMTKLIDDAAAAAAGRHADGPAVSVDRMTFLAAVRAGDLLSVEAGLERVGRTSMTVGVRVTAERGNSSGPATEVATAFLTFAAIDADHTPRPVPPLTLPTTTWDRGLSRHRGARCPGSSTDGAGHRTRRRPGRGTREKAGDTVESPASRLRGW
ncbi:acyl-CoA thioesterase [Streptomyces omiyaensis]|uniref:Acyl-CoA thioesterase n=1 Tax=Streptomyces omiyaensis TaxID=68247 RepID=A0ABW7BVS9_9ACTN